MLTSKMKMARRVGGKMGSYARFSDAVITVIRWALRKNIPAIDLTAEEGLLYAN